MSMARFIIMSLAFFLGLSACQEKEETNPVNGPESDEGSWLIYSPVRWTHDGSPLTGQYCKVYSDGASQSLKQQCMDFADAMFVEILDQFGLEDTAGLVLPPENEKINVYINTGHPENVAYAYWGTVFLTVRTPGLNTALYEYLFRHELTHELEFMVEQRVNLGTDFWFRESIAIYCGGGFNYITTVEDLEDWIEENKGFPGQGNPIMIHTAEDFPEGADIEGYYCKVFDITMKYLLSLKGLGKSCQDVLGVFYDVRDGSLFDEAFEAHFGLDLATFEVEYYNRIRDFLGSDDLTICSRNLKQISNKVTNGDNSLTL